MPRKMPSHAGPHAAELESLLRTALSERTASEIPLPPVKPLLAKWRAWRSKQKPAEVVPFPSAHPEDRLAFAARSGETISPESRAKLAQLLREMEKKPGADAR